MSDLSITPEMDRRNGLVFLFMYLAMFLAAPVSYIGVVQAALCDRLGSNAMVANLPAASYLFGGFAPLLLSLVVPHRLDRSVVVWANGLTALFIGVVLVALSLNLPPWIPLTVLVVQSLLQGFCGATAQVFLYQCLARGTTLEGRKLIFKRTFSLSPLSAIIGSLGAQFILTGGLRSVRFPYDFVTLYGVGFLCMTTVAVLGSCFDLAPVADEDRPPVFRYLIESVRDYVRSRSLFLLFGVYTLWYCALSVTPSLSLYTRHALNRDPKEFSGLIMALRFGCKAVGGYFLGVIAMRWGLRASVAMSSVLLAIGTLWGWLTPGYAFLIAFGFLGAGELGGAYIPNLAMALSTPAANARNISLLTLASTVSSFSPPLFGYLADHFGFGASFSFALTMALAAIWLTTRIPQPEAPSTVPA